MADQRRFTVVLEPEEDGGYSVHCPTLPGCVSQGDTREGALESIQEAILLVLEVMEQDQSPVPVETPEVITEEIRQILRAREEDGLPLTVETVQLELPAEVPRLPAVSGREAVSALERAGWHVTRQSGSHIILTRAGTPVTLSVPNHRVVSRGTLRSLIRKSGLTVDEFAALLGG